MHILKRPELQSAQRHFANAAQASRLHKNYVAELILKHGDGNGVQVSGVIRDHFPEQAKMNLIAICKNINRENDAGVAARPKHVRKETMFKLARAVCRRDGTGFYGFQI